MGRRLGKGDVLVDFSDGSYVNVHLTWGLSDAGPFADKYPAWFTYGSLEEFAAAMLKDAQESGNGYIHFLFP